ncbi:uncharacterized protein N7496_006356 [Penicillium cataractarum]|uniref:C2H2-type domain-containing protein n=1 Tax=Penicillium cataractarum TaxID=2100454 RepID=A0A9W9S436_9EURO|nr:uncharacterized protein N7496_006356 [Penicillium cataractarum]KAJ5370264.1 hypothetical protein N7496_006356 [Penicillium cataractarum]
MADFGDEPDQRHFHLLSLNRSRPPKATQRGDRSMPDKPRTWDFQAPTPTSQPLDFEEIHTGSPLACDALGGIAHYNNFQSEYATAEVDYLHDSANFQFVPSTINNEGLPAISDWLTDSWVPDDLQSPLGLLDYGFPEHYAAPVASIDSQEGQFDLTRLPHPGTSPSSLCPAQTEAYMPFLDTGEPSFHEPMVQSKTQAIPVQNLNRPSSLPRRRSQYSLRRLGETMSGRYTPNSTSSLDPMQRWQESPPEDEPASLSAIMQAVSKSERVGERLSVDEDVPNRRNASFRHHRRPASLASSKSGTSASSWQSSTSTRSAVSTPRSQSGNTRVGKSKRKPKKPAGLENDRIFCCTFCCDTFKNKFDWSRHEKSLHLNLGGWACTPHGGSTVSTVTGRMHCVYCNSPEPTPEHLDGHNHFQCSDSTRIFRRKDHLVQHLRLVHSLETLPVIDDWKIQGPAITSRCGFCDQRLENWDERADHLTNHFRQGMTMSDWKGDHEFPPAIASQVMNSLPPYLLSWESKTMVPFSASSRSAQDHLAQISARADLVAANASAQAQNEQSTAPQHSLQLPPVGETMVPLNTFTGILTQHLSRYARQQMSMGIIPTDEMFQQESRKLLYDSEDSWNQSIADNPAWILSFRQQLQVQPDNGAPTEAGQLEATMAEFSFKQ